MLPRRAHVGLRLGSSPAPAAAGGGLLVRGVAAGSCAERAGVREGDRLLELGGASVGELPSARALLRALSPGDALELALRRGDELLRLRETVQAFPLEVHAGARVLLDEVAVRGHRL